MNRIHTRVYLSVNPIQTTSYMIIFMTVTVVMPMDRWLIMTGAYIINSLNLSGLEEGEVNKKWFGHVEVWFGHVEVYEIKKYDVITFWE